MTTKLKESEKIQSWLEHTLINCSKLRNRAQRLKLLMMVQQARVSLSAALVLEYAGIDKIYRLTK